MESIESKVANIFHMAKTRKKNVGNLYKIRITPGQLSRGLSQGGTDITWKRRQAISKLPFLVEKTTR